MAEGKGQIEQRVYQPFEQKIEISKKGNTVIIVLRLKYEGVEYSFSVKLNGDGSVTEDTIQEATKNAVNKLLNDAAEIFKNLAENFGKLSSVLKSPLPEPSKLGLNINELIQGYIDIMEQSQKSTVLSDESKNLIGELLEKLRKQEAGVLHEVNPEDKAKIEEIIKILETFQRMGNLSLSKEEIINLVNELADRKLSTKENLKNIINNLHENNLEAALRMLIATISTSFRNNKLVLGNKEIFEAYIKPLVATVADLIVRRLPSSRNAMDRWRNVLGLNIEQGEQKEK